MVPKDVLAVHANLLAGQQEKALLLCGAVQGCCAKLAWSLTRSGSPVTGSQDTSRTVARLGCLSCIRCAIRRSICKHMTLL